MVLYNDIKLEVKKNPLLAITPIYIWQLFQPNDVYLKYFFLLYATINMRSKSMKMRWYDRDQAVSLAMSIIKNSTEKAQLKVARLITKKLNDFGITKTYTIFKRFEGFIKRWYDSNDDLFEALEALKAAPKNVQKAIALEVIRFLQELEVNEGRESLQIEEISTATSDDENISETDKQDNEVLGEIVEENVEEKI